MMAQTFQWGILGTGRVAAKFAQGLSLARGARLLAVGSRSAETAHEFGHRFEIPRRYATYEELVNDPDVEVVYVSSPHALHFEHASLVLRAGKAVLCEKPLTLNAAQARALSQEARRRGLFLMEGLWSRFFPLMRRVRDLLAGQALGEVHLLAADLGIRRSIETRERLFRRDLGGGALLDVGVYTVSLASSIFGNPDRVMALAHIGAYGVDERAAILLGYPGGALASLYVAIRTETPKEALILGSEGMIRIHTNFAAPTRMTVSSHGASERLVEEPIDGNGMHYEAEEVMRCLQDGRIESDIMPLDETASVLQTLDEVRRQWGLSYPSESAAEA